MTVISEDLLSRGQAGKIKPKVPACPRARRKVEKLVSSCHPVTLNRMEPMAWERLEGGIIIALRRIDADGYLICLDFLGCTDDCPVTTAVLGAHLFESEIIESLA